MVHFSFLLFPLEDGSSFLRFESFPSSSVDIRFRSLFFVESFSFSFSFFDDEDVDDEGGKESLPEE